jgi:hypothetical protein
MRSSFRHKYSEQTNKTKNVVIGMVINIILIGALIGIIVDLALSQKSQQIFFFRKNQI